MSLQHWAMPASWYAEIDGLLQRFGRTSANNTNDIDAGDQSTEVCCLGIQPDDLKRISVVGEGGSADVTGGGDRVILMSNFEPQVKSDILDEALRYLQLTLVEGFCDVIYPNWGDTPLDFIQLLAGMKSRNGTDLPVKLSRHNDWPLRGGFTRRIKELCFAIAKLDCNVLITGSSGCGKEAIARLIHRASGCKGSFVPVSVPAIPPNLFHAVLFGHQKGDFTGSTANQRGAFEKASGGTLFLDEIADMEEQQQAVLLRALSERKASTIGGTREFPINCRVISATNQQNKLRGNFRSDLRIRLAEQEVRQANSTTDWHPIRPLELVPDEIPLLFAMQFVRCFHEQIGYNVKVPEVKLTVQGNDRLDSKGALEILLQMDWTMNFRQLQQICLHALLRHLIDLDCMKSINTDSVVVAEALRKNTMNIVLKPYSQHDRPQQRRIALPDDMLKELLSVELKDGEKRWENIARWVREEVVEYLVRTGVSSDSQIAHRMGVNRSSISRFRSSCE